MSAPATQELAPKSALPEAVVRRGISESQWRTLFNLFPGGHPDSVLMVWDYCKSRQLDPMKKPCHIVPMRVKGSDGQWAWRDVVMPGIYEYRITAQRTGLYLGHSEPSYGETIEYLGVKAPAWCAMTFYRQNSRLGEKASFPVKLWFAEVVATRDKGDKESVNERWTKAPIQMLTKCTEAAGLREAFPEEFGGEATAEEMDGQRPIIETDERPSAPQPARRKSEQAETPAPITVEAEPVRADPAPTTAEPSPYIGRVAQIEPRQHGALVTLSTGFKIGTANADFIAALAKHKEAGTLIECVTHPGASNRMAPILDEIIAFDGEEAK